MFFFFNDTATTEIYTLSLHDALPICFSGKDAFTTAGDLGEALPGPPTGPQRRGGKKGAQPASDGIPASPEMPNPALAGSRAPSLTPQWAALPLNSFPRLSSDANGTVYLAFRSVGSQARSPVGSTWIANVA